MRQHQSHSAFSTIGTQITAGSGIESLMEDLGHALAEGAGNMCMLGGGNPAHIPAMEEVWSQRMQALTSDPAMLRRLLAVYDPPKGNSGFIQALAELLQREYGWPITAENIAVTGGGQTAFFCLFNLLAGTTPEAGKLKKILLPIVPEYIGYANQGMGQSIFRGLEPQIRETGPHSFKYQVDFDRITLDDEIAAVCVSRPTNPTGNVLSDAELQSLSTLTREAGIPLIIDNAYGLPFPGIIFADARPLWAEHHVFVMSLSKLGLPGTRTAVVIGPPEIVRAVTSMTAVMGLANGNFGQAIVRPLIDSGEILRLSREVIRPFYENKLRHARAVVETYFPKDSGYALHESGGALFLWLWLRRCPVDSRTFYERLKQKNVLVVPGDYFFFGLSESATPWRHRSECLRISFAMDDATVEKGLRIIGEEIRQVYQLT